MTDQPVLKKGVRFLHKSWLTEDLKGKVTCVVTGKSRGRVYWRELNPDGTTAGTPWFFNEDSAHKYVGEILPNPKQEETA